MAQLKSFFDLMNELSMKKDKNLPNLKVPAKGKKGVSKFMRKKAIGQAKDDLNASVQSADKKPEKYMKPDGKVGIRMVKTDKEVIKKEAMSLDQMMRMRYQAAASQKKNQKKTDDAEKKKMAAKADMDMRARREMVDPMDLRGRPKKRDPYPKSPYGLKHPLHPSNIAKRKAKEAEKNKKESVDEAVKNLSAADQVKAAIKIIRDKRFNMKSQIDKKTAIQKISKDLLKDPKVKKEIDKIYEENVEEALTMAQRMKKKRDMRRNKARIAVGRRRAKKRMANTKVLKRRSDRQARNAIAQKITRGIPKRDLTPARKREIEKRLESPALQRRIKVLSKRMFKDVRKKEVMRKKS